MPTVMDIRVAENGRLVLPRAVRDAMGLRGQGVLILTLDDDGVHLSPVAKGVSRARALYRAHAAQPRSVDAFLADRRAEAERDERKHDEGAAG